MAWTTLSVAPLPPVEFGVLRLRHLGKIVRPIVNRVVVDMVDDLSRLNGIGGVGEIPNEMRATNVPKAVDGRPDAFLRSQPFQSSPAGTGVMPALEVGMVGAVFPLASVDLGRNKAALIAAGLGAELRGFLCRVNPGVFGAAFGAKSRGFHPTQHSMDQPL